MPIVCPDCGGPRRVGLSFCGRCGYNFGQPFVPPPAARSPIAPAANRTLERTLLAGIAGVAVIGLILLVGLPPAAKVAPGDPSPAASGGSGLGAGTTPAPTTTVAPTNRPGLFAGQPYSIDLPAGWLGFDPTNPADQATTDALLTANPALSGPFRTFQSTANVRAAVQLALSNVLVVVPVTVGGLSLERLGQTVTSQLKLIPGLVGVPAPTVVALPAGRGLHWDVTIVINSVTGVPTQVHESVYLLGQGETAVRLEFVSVGGRLITDEGPMLGTFRFAPPGTISWSGARSSAPGHRSGMA